MDSDQDKIMKRVMLGFFGACLLFIAAAGSLKNAILITKGITTEAQIIAIKQVRDYSPVNKFRPDKFEVRLGFKDREGKPQIRDVELTMNEKKDYHAAVGSTLPLVYVPDGVSYAISPEIPSWTETIIACCLLLPPGIFLIFKAASGK